MTTLLNKILAMSSADKKYKELPHCRILAITYPFTSSTQ